ncbi:MAG: hypothetical protein EOR30_19165 [Mesorhizobium sp.]|uniref:hypothetical protein n=1 Tax=Mesorhizobium sp. TaxID=1871066 RepID=UPI000FE6AB2F|nr:hypothetical protein [Mesorhizobium sp.]RWF94113.1 MAG: hypothetical protein EOQ45_13980 [Mesorhizobium sp.]RWI40819.1 MAG: hypothetical protein EOR14_13805 [Mesorhizobium sp.]RWI64532.1 MAG: hypothetical protein EOR17_24585 [Mesorhizobium sp.]RWI83918.1 MAG: hypothetical protein EOR20_18945 [Mesorhizobium sp.]RWJ51799.1 MAG: hypothetical protein EOR30_19165 [Mesorhizobium sp.]
MKIIHRADRPTFLRYISCAISKKAQLSFRVLDQVEFYLLSRAFSGKVQRNVCRTVEQLPWKMVPRGGFEAKEIWLCFQIVDTHTRAGIANKNTNKIFLWIGSVPGYRSIRSMPSDPNLISEAER